ncbi:hypothetical protein K7432_017093 [Basidiobolus ranarum]|uniref:G protein-coupled receptor n=1 Tax=Basidiobolus ranarum TaxID=34480 RepID=A0ABR2VKX2_9FUNG
MVLPVTVTVSSVYCLIVVILICCRLYKASRDIQLKPNCILSDQVIRKATIRILLYPSVLIISQLPFSIAFAMTRLGNTDTSTDVGMYTMSIQGILNTIAFTFDPAFGIIYKSIENDLIIRYYLNESYLSQEKPLPTFIMWFVKKYLVPEKSQQVKKHEQLTITISEKRGSDSNNISGEILRMI